MDATRLIATVVVAATVAATPAAASAATRCSGDTGQCRIAVNHNEILDCD